MTQGKTMIPVERLEQAILLIRGQRVMLDSELATLYGVETRALNQAVHRHRDRFPADFMFELTRDEIKGISQAVASSGRLRSQFVTLKRGQHRKYPPHAFTQEGVAMLSSVLHSPQATQVNVAIMRAFVRLRQTLALHKDLAHKLAELERNIAGHDANIRTLFEVIRQLMTPPEPPLRQPIGFHVKERGAVYRAPRVATRA